MKLIMFKSSNVTHVLNLGPARIYLCMLYRLPGIWSFLTSDFPIHSASLLQLFQLYSATGCGARSTFLWAHRDLFWQLPRDGASHGTGMSRVTTASPKPSFRVPCRVGDAVVGRANAVWTTSKCGHPCPCQNCPQRPSAEKTGQAFLLNLPPCPSDNPIGQGTELN